MARPLRIQFEGALYHLIIRACHRLPLFRDDHDKERYLELLVRYKSQFSYKLYAYVLLKREVHLLLETPGGNVSRLMQCLGTSYTQYCNRRHHRRGTLLEGRYKSYLIHKESCLSEVTRYIHRMHFTSALNPKKGREYLWSSYPVYLGRGASDLVEVEAVLSRFGEDPREQQRRYQQYVERRGGDNTYPTRILFQQIVGPTDFVEKVFSKFQHIQIHTETSSLKKAEKILQAVSLLLAPDEPHGLQEKRRKDLVRHVAMYSIRRQTTLPLRSIGAMLGVKASAVALAIARLENLLKQDGTSVKVKNFLKLGQLSPPAASIDTSVQGRELGSDPSTS